MRVLHVLHNSAPHVCGYSVRSGYITRFERDQGIEPACVTSAQQPPENNRPDTIDGVPYWRTPALEGRQAPLLREWRMMRALRGRVETAVRQWQPDLIHAHSPVLVGLPALWAARRARLPLVYEVRDLWENASVDHGKFAEGSPLYRVARRLETSVLRRADAVVTICRQLRSELAPRTGNPEKLFVVDNGVDGSAFRAAEDAGAARRQLGLTGRKIFCYVGTFQPYEGLELLIAALPAVLRDEPQAHLLLTGGGGAPGLGDRLAEQARSLGVAERVTFTGKVPHAAVRALYAAADVMVYPRILTRVTALTTPLKPLEAMAMGKAVIVSDVAAMAELVQPESTGLTFRAGDVSDLARQVSRLLGSPSLREALGARARAWTLEERQWPDLVARYYAIYRSVLRGAAPAHGHERLQEAA